MLFMNYFAHGRAFLDRPYFLAGVALPDWLSVVDRRVRVRSKSVQAWLEADDRESRELAAGVTQHHADDHWFHATRAFAELSLQFTVTLRDRLPEDAGLRPSFLGHILVEILLDEGLIARDPDQLDEYYAALERVNPVCVVDFVERATNKNARLLADFIPRFLHARFLYDYADNGKLLYRLNQVMRRVRLAPLPETLLDLLPRMKSMVRERTPELLNPAEGE